MASLSAAAIVVSHARKDLLVETLAGLSQQTVKPTQVVVVETSNDLSVQDLVKQFNFQAISVENISLNFAVNAGVSALQSPVQWLWILHDDSAPTPNALEKLLIAAETSESVAVVGPKLLRADHPAIIQQLGLSATKTGRPFVLVQDEYDQGQHDNLSDVLAVSTAGMLVASAVWSKLGGLNEAAPALAQDLDFGARCRAAGYRVIVEPQSKVLHHALSITGQRPKAWTNGSWQTALAKSESYIATMLLPLPVALLRILLLPLRALLQIPLHLYRRRPGRILADFTVWLWSWVKLPMLFASKSRFRNSGNPSSIKTLYASADQIRLREESKLEHQDVHEANSSIGLVASGAIWLALAPLILNFAFFPSGPAISAPRALFSANSLAAWLDQISALSVLDFEGKSYLVDAAIWWHGLFALASPEMPSLALASFVFLATAIAYLGLWKLLSLFSKKAVFNSLLALATSIAFAGLVLPMVNFAAIALLAVLPWTLWATLRMQLSEISARANRWLGLSAILLASVATISPVTALLILIWTLSFKLKLSNIFRSLLAAIPATLLVLPNLITIPFGTGWLIFTETANLPGDLNYLAFFATATGLVIAFSASFWGSRLAQTVRLAILTLVFLLIAIITPSEIANFFLAATLVPMALAVGGFFAGIKPKVALPTALILGVSLAIVPVLNLLAIKVEFGTSQQVPALIAVSNNDGQLTRTAKLSTLDSALVVSLVTGDGADLSESSLQRLITAKPNPDLENDLALAFARLSVGNSSGVLDLLQKHSVNFVLVEKSASENVGELNANLASVAELQFAGVTDFGWLYRVGEVPLTTAPISQENPWLAWQLAALIASAVICLPTPASIRGTRRLGRTEVKAQERP